ncbi:MAG: Gfo/Idh/MocA family oxidoreductase [Solibacillus sp.]
MGIRWGIIGAAMIAKNKVMPAIEANGGTIQAIASRSQPVDELVKRYHIREIYKDYRQLLASKSVDAVYIALPNSMHYMWVVEAIRRGKHVLIEKPIVLSLEQIEDIKKLAEQHNIVVMEAFMYRFHPQIEAAKRMLQDGEIGDIVAMRSQFHFVLEDWERDIRITPMLGGGVLYDIGCYCINIQQYMLGEQVYEAKFISEWHNEVDVKVSGLVQYESGIVGQIDCSFSGSFTETFDVIGSEGMLRLPHAFRTDMNGHTGVIELYKEQDMERHYYEGDAYQLQIEHFEQVVAGAEPHYSLADMLAQTKALTELYKKL